MLSLLSPREESPPVLRADPSPRADVESLRESERVLLEEISAALSLSSPTDKRRRAGGKVAALLALLLIMPLRFPLLSDRWEDDARKGLVPLPGP